MIKNLELKIHPPVVAMLFAAAGWLGSRLAFGGELVLPYRKVLVVMLVLAGLVVAMSGLLAFVRARTTVNPKAPERSSAVVSSGIYRYTRNPMYLGFVFLLTAWAVYLGHLVPWLLIPLFMVFLTRLQIRPEERALTKLFGDEYREYRQRVRRWL